MDIRIHSAMDWLFVVLILRDVLFNVKPSNKNIFEKKKKNKKHFYAIQNIRLYIELEISVITVAFLLSCKMSINFLLR